MAKRYKPPVRSICVIGTLAHNRGGFTLAELRQYVRFDGSPAPTPKFIAWLKKHGHVRQTSVNRGLHALTPKGWKMVEAACHSPKARR